MTNHTMPNSHAGYKPIGLNDNMGVKIMSKLHFDTYYCTAKKYQI